MNSKTFTRFLSLALAFVLCFGLVAPAAHATEAQDLVDLTFEKIDAPENAKDLLDIPEVQTQPQEKVYAPNEMVRVSILMEEPAALYAGYETAHIASNEAAQTYRANLEKKQASIASRISSQVLGGQKLDVVWNLTLAANLISANVPYGKLDAIAAMDGVADVVIEQQYLPQTAEETAQPNMGSSSNQIGSNNVWAEGYTGAGSRIAVIDTGTDVDHQSFDNGAFLYSLEQNAKAKGMTTEAYMESLNLLGKEEITEILPKLNMHKKNAKVTADDLYLSNKLAFAFNYVDADLYVGHYKDFQSEHGSHVAGIATANKYIPQGGKYVPALENVFVNGVAPDAQLLTMKVFGLNGGAYDADYMAAIEDAILLDCDVVNLSLGGSSAGAPIKDAYQKMLDDLEKTDIVVVISAGNSGNWAEETQFGYLFSEDVNLATNGAPGSLKNSLCVASVENAGYVSYVFEVGDKHIPYHEVNKHGNTIFRGLDTTGKGTTYEYIFSDGLGKLEDFEGLDLTGKIVFASRGEITFAEKANNIASLGAAGVVLYDNVYDKKLGLDLTGYKYETPVVSLLKKDAEVVRAASKAVEGTNCYTGELTITSEAEPIQGDSAYYTMSGFSSWGIPTDLSMKPEITAPGGNIYSVNGLHPIDQKGTMAGGSDQYEPMSGTSMAAPQVTGMMALVAQYFRENGVAEKTGMTPRHLAQSLLMSTADPIREEASGGNYYSILNQGAGLARVDQAVDADSYILVEGQDDGKVKVELRDDPERTGVYEFSFTIHNMTDKAQEYTLHADMFSQDVVLTDLGYMMDTWTAPIAGAATFAVNGKTINNGEAVYDLNKDGKVDVLDADFLLEVLVGNEEYEGSLDVNGDGFANTYDAYWLLSTLNNENIVTVPASGELTVDVTMTLSNHAKAQFAEKNPNGAYIMAYVYADGETEHHIPVLGYYGSWTEPSMFDRGSWAEVSYGEPNTSYLGKVHGDEYNFFTAMRDGREVYYDGNPIMNDPVFMPERGAINSELGDGIDRVFFSLVRSTGDARILVRNVETGEVYKEIPLGSMTPAYFTPHNGQWNESLQVRPIEWYGTDAKGHKLPENTKVEVILTALPYLYRNEDGTYNYEDAAEGASLVAPVTIDNTAPEVYDIVLDVKNGNQLRVEAMDNQYVAAVALMNASASAYHAFATPEQTEPGEHCITRVDLNGVRGEEFTVAVFDYAGNATYYSVNLPLPEPERPYFTVAAVDEGAYVQGYPGWLGVDAVEGPFSWTPGPVTLLGHPGNKMDTRAADYADGYVFEVNQANEFFVAKDTDLTDFHLLADFTSQIEGLQNFADLAYNDQDGMLYGLYEKASMDLLNPDPTYFCVIDPRMGTVKDICRMPEFVNGLACDDEGNFYGVNPYVVNPDGSTTSHIYTFTLDEIQEGTMNLVGNTGFWSMLNEDKMTTLAWDPNQETLYWGFADSIFHVDLTKTEDIAEPVACFLAGKLCGLYIRPQNAEPQFPTVDRVVRVAMDPEATSVLVNQEVKLFAQAWPWSASNTELIWSSSDPDIASVDENGLVRGLKKGVCTITATSALTPSVSASCELTVKTLDTELNALIWHDDGSVWWSKFNTENPKAFESLTETETGMPFNAATLAPDGTILTGALDVNALTSELYAVDPDTLEYDYIGATDRLGYMDLTYSPTLYDGSLVTVFGTDVVTVDPNTGLHTNGISLWYGVAVVGISYAATMEADLGNGETAPIDLFFVVDNQGNLYLFGFILIGEEIKYVEGVPGGIVGNFGYTSDTPFFSSLYFDGQYVYWAAFNEASNNSTLLACDFADTGRFYNLGDFGPGVWPVGGLMEMNRNPVAPQAMEKFETMFQNAVPMSAEEAKLEKLDVAESPVGHLNAAAQITSEMEDEDTFVTMEVTAADVAHNGRITVDYDTEVLKLVSVSSASQAFAYADHEGELDLAYAGLNEIGKDETIAVVRFEKIVREDSDVFIHHVEINDGPSNAEEHFLVEGNCPSKKYEDVDQNKWYHTAVDYVIENGLMQGANAEDTLFAPNAKLTRGMMVTILYRMAGSPEVELGNTFTDVANDKWYAPAISWAVENGIAKGMTADRFAPKMDVTREQMATFMMRFGALQGMDMTVRGDLDQFTDAEKINDYAVEAISWAVGSGLMNGMGNNALAPRGDATRAQAATMLMRLDLALPR